MRRVSREIEHEMFYGLSSPKEKLCNLLNKLGVKSAHRNFLIEEPDFWGAGKMLASKPTKK